MKKTRILAILAASVMVLTSCGKADLKETAVETKGISVSAGDVATFIMAYSGEDNFDSAKEGIAKSVKENIEFIALGKAMDLELTEQDKLQASTIRSQLASSNGGFKAFKKYLENNGSSIEFYDMLGEGSLYSTKVSEKINEAIGETEATDEELKAFYDEHYYRAKHILISIDDDTDEKAAEKLANEYLERAKGGEDFDAMIKELSEDPGSETNPDGYTFTDGEMVKEFEETVKSLKSGEFGICKSTYGYHVILRLDLGDFEAEKSSVSNAYSDSKYDAEFDKLLKEYNIEVKLYDDVIKSLKADMLSEMPKTDDSLGMSF